MSKEENLYHICDKEKVLGIQESEMIEVFVSNGEFEMTSYEKYKNLKVNFCPICGEKSPHYINFLSANS